MFFSYGFLSWPFVSFDIPSRRGGSLWLPCTVPEPIFHVNTCKLHMTWETGGALFKMFVCTISEDGHLHSALADC